MLQQHFDVAVRAMQPSRDPRDGLRQHPAGRQLRFQSPRFLDPEWGGVALEQPGVPGPVAVVREARFDASQRLHQIEFRRSEELMEGPRGRVTDAALTEPGPPRVKEGVEGLAGAIADAQGAQRVPCALLQRAYLLGACVEFRGEYAQGAPRLDSGPGLQYATANRRERVRGVAMKPLRRNVREPGRGMSNGHRGARLRVAGQERGQRNDELLHRA